MFKIRVRQVVLPTLCTASQKAALPDCATLVPRNFTLLKYPWNMVAHKWTDLWIDPLNAGVT